MTTIHIREQGATVRRRGERLVISKHREVLDQFPFAKVEELALYGNVQVTAQAMATLLEKGVRVIYLSSYGKMRGVVSSGSKQAQLRKEQYRLMSDDTLNLQLAKAVVQGKVHNQRVLLQRQSRRMNSEASPIDFSLFNNSLKGMMEMGKSALNANSANNLRGYEGKAAAYYFRAVRSLIGPEWGFERRAFYPPPDPFNALLSFSYSLLTKDVIASVNLVGLDAYLGFFHEIKYGRPSLALDLMEEWRPIVADSLALELVNRNMLRPEHFAVTGRKERPIELGEALIPRVLQAYGQRMDAPVQHALAGGPSGGSTPLRRAIELQVRRLARVISGQDKAYEPMKAR